MEDAPATGPLPSAAKKTWPAAKAVRAMIAVFKGAVRHFRAGVSSRIEASKPSRAAVSVPARGAEQDGVDEDEGIGDREQGFEADQSMVKAPVSIVR